MRRYQYYFIVLIFIVIALVCVFSFIYYIPAQASLLYGPPAKHLSIPNRIEYSARLLSYGDELSTPLNPAGVEQPFIIESGESVSSIANRLESQNLISNSRAFFDYVVYVGLDLTIQAGRYSLSSKQSIIDIAQALQKFSPTDATLVILAGWRMEEIAASLPTSGLNITPEAFLSAAQTLPQVLSFTSASSMEGFFFPDTYTMPRETTVGQLLDIVA